LSRIFPKKLIFCLLFLYHLFLFQEPRSYPALDAREIEGPVAGARQPLFYCASAERSRGGVATACASALLPGSKKECIESSVKCRQNCSSKNLSWISKSPEACRSSRYWR
jgi:hypothetical protein